MAQWRQPYWDQLVCGYPVIVKASPELGIEQGQEAVAQEPVSQGPWQESKRRMFVQKM